MAEIETVTVGGGQSGGDSSFGDHVTAKGGAGGGPTDA